MKGMEGHFQGKKGPIWALVISEKVHAMTNVYMKRIYKVI